MENTDYIPTFLDLDFDEMDRWDGMSESAKLAELRAPAWLTIESAESMAR